MEPIQPPVLRQRPEDHLRNKRVHIFGACGAEGAAILDWVRACVPTARVVAHDVVSANGRNAEWQRTHEGASDEQRAQFDAWCADPEITWALAEAYATPIADDGIIFLPQSWFRYERNNFLKQFFADDLSVREEYLPRVWTITRLYAALSPAKLIMVTGADGKTTTTRMIGAVVRAHAHCVGAACVETGNDRTHQQQLAHVAALTGHDFLVLEVSDRQLSFGFHFEPDVAVVTNVTPNKHMVDYGGFDAYVQVKGNVLRWQRPDQYAVLNADDQASRSALAAIGSAQRQWVSLRELETSGVCVRDGRFIVYGEVVLSVDELGVAGQHNWYNACAALATAHVLGVNMRVAAQVLCEFSGVQHRLQTVRQWHGVTFVEDSAGGNPVNVAVTIRAFADRPLVLIVGGYRPQMTREEVLPILAALREQHTVRDVLLIGQAAGLLHDFFSDVLTAESLHIVTTLDGAFGWIQNTMSTFTSGTVVCMTPGFESFDQYGDYRARAAHFVVLANSLPL